MRPRNCSKGRGRRLLEGRQTGLDYDVTSLSAVAFNSTIAGIEKADAVLLVGSNIRWEAPLIATRLRKVAQQGRQGVRHRARGRPRHAGRLARRRSEAARQAAQGGGRRFRQRPSGRR